MAVIDYFWGYLLGLFSECCGTQARDHRFGGRPDGRSDMLLGHQMMK
ncbi:hypothetical protein [Mesorhizobium sp.]|nr:hypothetical protein [Mesorhizobium sp.]